MQAMDDRSDPQPVEQTESLEALHERLTEADPADAPPIADELASRLADQLDERPDGETGS